VLLLSIKRNLADLADLLGNKILFPRFKICLYTKSISSVYFIIECLCSEVFPALEPCRSIYFISELMQININPWNNPKQFFPKYNHHSYIVVTHNLYSMIKSREKNIPWQISIKETAEKSVNLPPTLLSASPSIHVSTLW